MPQYAVKVEQPIAAPKRKRGRPAGVVEKTATPYLWQRNAVASETELEAAVKDILWRGDGRWYLMAEIVKRLKFCGSLTAKQAIAIIHRKHEIWGISKRVIHSTKTHGLVERFTTSEQRSGWYWKGELRSVRFLSKKSVVAFEALRRRLVAGWDIDAALAIGKTRGKSDDEDYTPID